VRLTKGFRVDVNKEREKVRDIEKRIVGNKKRKLKKFSVKNKYQLLLLTKKLRKIIKKKKKMRKRFPKKKIIAIIIKL
jgi:hypothetical protein